MTTLESFIKYDRRKESPCLSCIIRSTCSKSFVLGTACKPYGDFIINLIDESTKKYNHENQN